jgi:hypothetical protein
LSISIRIFLAMDGGKLHQRYCLNKKQQKYSTSVERNLQILLPIGISTFLQCFGFALVSMRIRIQHFRSIRIRMRRIRIQIQGLMTKNWKKKNFSWKKICIVFVLLRTSKLQHNLHPSKENIQHFNMKFLNLFLILWVFLPSWIRNQPTKINADPCGSGSETLIFSMSLKKCRFCSKWRLAMSRSTWWTP